MPHPESKQVPCKVPWRGCHSQGDGLARRQAAHTHTQVTAALVRVQGGLAANTSPLQVQRHEFDHRNPHKDAGLGGRGRNDMAKALGQLVSCRPRKDVSKEVGSVPEDDTRAVFGLRVHTH